jgi:hypothetical protein
MEKGIFYLKGGDKEGLLLFRKDVKDQKINLPVLAFLESLEKEGYNS